MATTKLKPIWWCEPDFLPGVTTLHTEVRLENGGLLSGVKLIPNNVEWFVLEEAIMELKYAFECHFHEQGEKS